MSTAGYTTSHHVSHCCAAYCSSNGNRISPCGVPAHLLRVCWSSSCAFASAALVNSLFVNVFFEVNPPRWHSCPRVHTSQRVTFFSLRLKFLVIFPLVHGTCRSTLSPTSYPGRARSSMEKKSHLEARAPDSLEGALFLLRLRLTGSPHCTWTVTVQPRHDHFPCFPLHSRIGRELRTSMG